MRNLAIISLALAVANPLMAAPPPLPAFVQIYFDTAELKYVLPRGRFDAETSSLFLNPKQAEPWAVIADLNGDSVDDWGGLLRNSDGGRDLVVVFSVTGDYAHAVLSELGPDAEGIGVGVELVPAGEVEGFPFNNEAEDPVLLLDDPGIHLIFFGKSSVLFYWQDGMFEEFWTSD